jgi:hypothetical protein
VSSFTSSFLILITIEHITSPQAFVETMKCIGSASVILLSASSALAAGTLEFSIGSKQHSHLPELIERDVDGTSESALLTNFAGSMGLRYFINLTVGTPPQPQTVFIDTGSSDTILLAADAPFCQGKKSKSKCPAGSYNTSASSTFTMLSTGAIDANYGQNANATAGEGGLVADLVTDVLQIGGLVVTGAHFGLAHEAKGNFLGNGGYAGIMGLAYPATEALKEGLPKYPTFVESLVGAKAIASRLFSLYLNEMSSYGSILFGGVDTEKYNGNLTTLNLLPSGTEETKVQLFALRLDQVITTHDDGTEETIVAPKELKGAVWPDSGTATWNVPTDTYNKIVNMTGVKMSGSNAVIPCSKISNKTSLTFTFSGNGTNKAQLEVSLSSFFIPATLADGSGIAKVDGEEACLLMVQEAAPASGIYLMGAPVMRAGYWVFDLDNGQLSIAQARLSSTTSNIVTIEAGPHGVMNATNQPTELGANQTAKIDGTATASVSYALSTASSAVGQTAGPQSTVLSSGAVVSVLDLTAGLSLASVLLLSVACGAFLL